MTARRPTWAPIGPECEVAPGDWLEIKTAVPAPVVGDYLMTVWDGVR